MEMFAGTSHSLFWVYLVSITCSQLSASAGEFMDWFERFYSHGILLKLSVFVSWSLILNTALNFKLTLLS